MIVILKLVGDDIDGMHPCHMCCVQPDNHALLSYWIIYNTLCGYIAEVIRHGMHGAAQAGTPTSANLLSLECGFTTCTELTTTLTCM